MQLAEIIVEWKTGMLFDTENPLFLKLAGSIYCMIKKYQDFAQKIFSWIHNQSHM